MIDRNPNLPQLSNHYLFVEIQKKKQAFLEAHPGVNIISLGIGDTTSPFSYEQVRSFMNAALDQGSSTTYCGYGPEQGLLSLRQLIAQKLYKAPLDPDEIFISDGAKCDIARLQFLFGTQRDVAIQDPTYPVYLDSSILQGAKSVSLMPCLPENNFFPSLEALKPKTILYICSPNNPTGVVYTHRQLQQWVDFAHKNESLLLFDAAYSGFIQDPSLPKSIYEIEGAKQVAIELNSFSKLAGYTGVRLSWSVVPKALLYASKESIHQDWKRIVSTTFNGASILSQKGAIALLSSDELFINETTLKGYLENAKALKEVFQSFGFEVYGGDHSPYLWVLCSPLTSWQAFDILLESCHLLTTPGSGFGPCGEGFIRLSAFGSKELTCKALDRLQKGLKKLQEKTACQVSFS